MYKQMLIDIIESNNDLMRIFNTIDEIGIENYYVGAGAIVQTVWNHLLNKPLFHGISDVDIVYFKETDLTELDENLITKELNELLENFPVKLDVKNEARVHLWYEAKFGYKIDAYNSLEDAIDTWPTTATAIGVRRHNNAWEIYAPFGLKDLFELKVVANKKQVTEEIYNKKSDKWLKNWSELIVVLWSSSED